MILDTLKNSSKYTNVHPRFKQAFDFLLSNDLAALSLGKIELDGSNLVVNIVDAKGKTIEEARMETHNKFIDIQVPIGAIETMGWKSTSKLETITDAYNETKDLTFYADVATTILHVQPFEFAVFFPDDGHQPGIGTGIFRKVIVKVRV